MDSLENEVREVVYLAVSLILVAAVLAFVNYISIVRGDMAELRNNEIQSGIHIEQYRDYNGYDRKEIIGEDVVELIRGKYDQITIYMDYRINDKTGSEVSSDDPDECYLCLDGYDHRTFNYDMYLAHKDVDAYNYFSVSTAAVVQNSNSDMRSWFPTGVKYRAFLVVNSKDPETVCDEMLKEYNDSKSSYMSDSELLNLIDSLAPTKTSSDEVTAIILISYKTLGVSED